MVTAAAIIPSIATRLPFTRAADAIALVGLFATARVFLSLAAMDVGTAFGTLGARREMMIGFLAEPALLMVIFVASLISRDHGAASDLRDCSPRRSLALYPSLAFTAIAFTMVLLAENARIPIDNPATHLELTMIHEAMLLEYSARHLALMEWAAALKLFNYACIGFALFIPWGSPPARRPVALWPVVPLLGSKARASLAPARPDRNAVGEAARVPRAGVSGHCIPVRRARACSCTCCWEPEAWTALPFDLQILNLWRRCCSCCPSRCSRNGAS